MADGKRRYKSDRKDYKISVKLSEKDMDILKAARRLYYSDIDKLQSSLDDIKKTFGEVLEVWRLQRS